jgi:hypothetical protein
MQPEYEFSVMRLSRADRAVIFRWEAYMGRLGLSQAAVLLEWGARRRLGGW